MAFACLQAHREKATKVLKVEGTDLAHCEKIEQATRLEFVGESHCFEFGSKIES